ncbi:unnamed protein product [Haemonchus placei]|uniref:Uncharacterized protein n=1 Tax=Haemonchus placei TaxID=6290 RepID=A0A3P7VX63_HAEPC|nr:unnamed protein product [Haemonchus placei]
MEKKPFLDGRRGKMRSNDLIFRWIPLTSLHQRLHQTLLLTELFFKSKDFQARSMC